MVRVPSTPVPRTGFFPVRQSNASTTHHIEEVLITDTIPLGDKTEQTGKVKVITVAELLAEAIRRIHEDESVSSLFT